MRHKHLAVGSASATFPLVLALLFSVHSFIAGLALGIQATLLPTTHNLKLRIATTNPNPNPNPVQSEKSSSAVAILIAILGHKFVEVT